MSLQRVVFRKVQTKRSCSTIVWREEKIGDKGESIPDNMPTVLVVQESGGEEDNCSKGCAFPSW
jgi:hypothetical protein